MKYISIILLICSLSWLTACDKDDDVTPAPEGIVFSPVKPYQEAYPGSVITFKLKAKAPEAVTKFAVRFQLPGTADYVSLPAYPDLTQPGEFTNGFGVFEYALPPSSTIVTPDLSLIKFKFIATTASKTYESEYTVKMVNQGERRARLYSQPASSYFKFSALDLLNSSGVPASFPATTQDLVATTVEAINTLTDQKLTLLTGFASGNGTKFKPATVTQYNAVAQYATAYASIAPASELNGASTLGANPVTGIGSLVAGTYYIAKINRPSGFSYVGLSMKKIPTTASGSTTTSSVDLTNEYLEAEIKK